jgi:hypothetical protein
VETHASPRWAASLGAATLVLVLGWFAFVEHTRVPLLGWCDLGVHEFGHFLFMALQAPELVVAIMGNGSQTLMPLLLAGAFLFTRGDWAGVGICLAWAGTTMQDASVYIADAPYQRLELFTPGGEHDWAFVLGPDGLNVLERAGPIASLVNDVGLVVLVLGLCACIVPAALRQLEAQPAGYAETDAP